MSQGISRRGLLARLAGRRPDPTTRDPATPAPSGFDLAAFYGARAEKGEITPRDIEPVRVVPAAPARPVRRGVPGKRP